MDKMKRTGMKITGGLLALTLFVLPATPVLAEKLPGSAYSPVQLEAVQTKEMTYYKAGSASIPGNIEWVTDASALKFLPLSVIGDVTSVVLDGGVYWIGTETGLQRVDFSASDTKDIVQYMAGPRYLYGGDDHVTGLASDGKNGIWVRTASGVTHIAMPEKTLHDKSFIYEELVQSILDRRGMVHGAGFTFTEKDSTLDAVNYNSATGVFTSTPTTSDNDGLWTAMYAMGEIFRYKALQEQYGTSPASGEQAAEIAAARAAALRATKAVLLLDYVSGRGNGFPARSYMLTSEASAATVDNSVYGYQSQNGFWFQNFVGPDMINPNGIIPSMQRDDGVAPIGYSMVRVTKDAENKKGSTLFPSGGTDVLNYNGLGLSQAAIDELNLTRPEGQKLGIDIKTRVGTSVTGAVYQVLPVITAATNNNDAKEDKTTGLHNKPLFQLTAPVYEQIPSFFNDLFPESAIVDGHIDMNQIVYKADTSADEVDGHYAMFYTAYKYLIGDSSDPELLELKALIEETTHRMTELILKDDHYYIEDATGKSTQWSRWFAKYFNDSVGTMEKQEQWKSKIGVDEKGDDALSYGYEDGPLNALQVMAALKSASYIVAASYPADSAKYELAYEQAFAGSYSKEEPYINGRGYMAMAQEYIERRLVRQATNAYSENENQPVTMDNVGAGTNTNATLHNDWTQYINYSDEELGWFPVFILVTLEQDADRHAQIVAAYDQWYSNEVREENPFYTFLYQLAHPDKTDVDLQSAVRFLYRFPEFQIEFPVQWERQDVLYIEPGDRDDYKQTNYALAPDERRIIKHNSNPFENDSQTTGANPGYNYRSGSIEAGSVFTLPYWLGRYFGIIQE